MEKSIEEKFIEIDESLRCIKKKLCATNAIVFGIRNKQKPSDLKLFDTEKDIEYLKKDILKDRIITVSIVLVLSVINGIITVIF